MEENNKKDYFEFFSNKFIVILAIVNTIISVVLVNLYFSDKVSYESVKTIDGLTNAVTMGIAFAMWRSDKYFKKDFLPYVFLSLILCNIIIAFLGNVLDFRLSLHIVLGILKGIIIQFVYNDMRKKSYQKYKKD